MLFKIPTQSDVSGLFHSSQQGGVMPGNSSTVMSGYGICAGSTLSSDSSSANGLDSLGRYFNSTSAATTSSRATTYTPDEVTRLDIPSFSMINCSIDRVTNCRFFAGFIASTLASSAVGADTLGASGFGFQFSTDRGDTVLQVISYNGTTQTTTPTTITPVADTFYSFRFKVISSSNVYAAILNSAGSTLYSTNITQTLPSSTTSLFMCYGAETRTNSALTLRYRSFAITNFGYVDPFI